MKMLLLCAAGAMMLAACNNAPEIDEKNASVGEVAAKVRQASGDEGFVRPGEWTSHVTIEEFSVPGLSADMAKNMRAAMARQGANDFKSCLTEEEAKKPKGDFFTGNDQCRYDHFKMGGGKIDAAMRCDGGPAGGQQVMTMTGTYGPEQYAMQMTMNAGQAAGTGNAAKGMTMKMRVESKRIGECTAETASAGR